MEIFGPDRAFLPATLDGLFQGNEDGLELGLLRVLPDVKDPVGRRVLLMDPSKQDSSRFERVQMVQSVWYGIHAVLEDEETQKRGVLCMACPRHARLSQFDSKLDQMIVESVKGYLPIRISCIAICHPPSFFRIIWPIVRVFLGSRLRKRVHVFGGSDDSVVKKLEALLKLSPDQIPELIGGKLKLNHLAWLEERRAAGK